MVSDGLGSDLELYFASQSSVPMKESAIVIFLFCLLIFQWNGGRLDVF